MGGSPPAATTSAAASSLRASRPSARMAPFLLASTCRHHAGRGVCKQLSSGAEELESSLASGWRSAWVGRLWHLQTGLRLGPGSEVEVTSALAAYGATT